MEDNNSLWQREAEKFEREHSSDTPEQLLELLRERAQELGRAPTRQEFYGSALLKKRFGPWPRVLIAAGLKEDKSTEEKQAHKRSIEQKDKARRNSNKKDQSRSKRREERARLEYEEAHTGDTDEALLKELKVYALQKGKTPSKDEYPGSGLLTKRFGSWREAVEKAGLELKHAELSKRAARKLMSEEERRQEQRELTHSA
ncbi:MAG: hypothetical protein IKM51_03160, partial [Oscillospiraceae bacterium]|nr:hypothetical protein [Oscillospiraceae bacterium]